MPIEDFCKQAIKQQPNLSCASLFSVSNRSLSSLFVRPSPDKNSQNVLSLFSLPRAGIHQFPVVVVVVVVVVVAVVVVVVVAVFQKGEPCCQIAHAVYLFTKINLVPRSFLCRGDRIVKALGTRLHLYNNNNNNNKNIFQRQYTREFGL